MNPTKFSIGDIVKHKDYRSNYTIKKIIGDKLVFENYESWDFLSSDYELVKCGFAPIWKIESDGTNAGTKVWINGYEMVNILEIEFTSMKDSMAKLKVVINGPSS